MKKMFIRMELAVMRFVLRVYKRIKRMFVKPLELQGMTVDQLLDSKEFRKELELQLQIEEKHHTEMSYQAVGAGLRLQRSPIQRLMEKKVFNVDDIIAAYKNIVCKTLQGFSAAEREYIKNVCMMAYWRVVDSYKREL
jgi:hypothetical protein